ncbi:SH3 domain-containing protein [Lactarius pseudohatsudake]|nr:SH3 domain-containing protein [Lactarius pseudohatsudake]
MSDEQYLAVLKASYDYVPQSGDEIEIKEDQLLLLVEKTDDDWWRVKVKGDDQSGLVPSAYVESAEHSSIVKVQYDYIAVAEGELSVKEGQLLLVFGPEEDGWLLVQDKDDGKVGYVPGNYIEAVDDASSTAAVPSATPNIVVPDSPPRRARPVSTYVDPAELVRSTASKVKADAIKTWSVSEIDKKGKKKKGTLGVGNGAIFFASEADKTPVQKWQIGDITSADIDKSKHILIEVGGSAAASLHFHAGNKDTAEEILAKLESSRSLARESIEAPAASAAATKHQAEPEPEPEPAQAPVQRTLPPPLLSNGSNSPGKKGVHFSEASPAIIPPRPASPPEPEHEEAEGLEAAALYDFQAQGDDELTVAEGDALWIIEQEGDEWWKCRNIKGDEGVVPASYIEVRVVTP